jgi:hypothetical protein
MRTRAFIAGFLLVVGAGAGSRLSACGDKFLMLSRGTRYERSPAARQASGILLYANPASELSRTLSRLAVDSMLQRAGYKPTTVSSEADLDKALLARKWDVVVVDAQDSQTISRRVQTAGGPRVVPVLTKPTKDELTQAKKAYHTVVNTPTKSRAFVDTIEDAMDLHDDEARAAAKKTMR